jgi:bifunctional non-homologous end joining protein LigD
MSTLDAYRTKRDFAVTPEPAPDAARVPGTGLAFVVQKHAARRLHFDLRLEWGGVLWSWAVTRGPSADPGEKRLAVRTEDHPLSYAGFEGIIPKGEYGGGTVMLWDQGTWEPQGDPDAGIGAGKLKFRLDGARMRGGWTLVRLRRGEARENWLLIKERDAHAGRSPDALVNRHRTSVTTGRSMAAIARGAATASPPRTQPRPAFRAVQLATLAEAPPGGAAWVHEPKIDGYRCLIALGKDGARLYTRAGHDWTDRFGALKAPAEALPCDSALIDGEVMAGPAWGDFGALQTALKDGGENGGALSFLAFDLLHLDGRDFASRSFEERREALEALFAGVPERGALRLGSFLSGTGAEALAAMCRAGGEGIVSKRTDASYRGGRGRTWIKTKCARRAEFVIAGWMPSDKAGRPFSSLVLASREKGALTYRGRVGTGFDGKAMAELMRLMAPLARKTASLDEVPAETRGARWLRPDLVAEIAYAEFTAEGRLRHAVFHGLRADKPAEEVSTMAEERLGRGDERIGGMRISSAGRVVFPGAGLTKGDIARHYDLVADRMLESAAGHPASLVRCPDGVGKACFFQKHAGKGFPSALRTMPIEDSKDGVDAYIYLTDRASVLAAVQMGTVEFHIWGAARDRLERPDRMVLDLDPDEGLGFDAVRAAAGEVRGVLEAVGLPSVPMVTGGKGVHVIVPLRRTAGWETVKMFSRTLATALADRHPDRYVATMSKARRKGRVFIDWLRNERGATAIAPYALRARPGARVAVPVTWEELADLTAANSFTAADMKARVAVPCPLAGVTPKGIGAAVVAALGDWVSGG